MNLTSSPWIPVLMLDGKSQTMSLNDLFSQSTSIADLSLATHERISVMRLLICITQAAIGFPEHEDDWDGFGNNLETEVPNYLQKWHSQFELFGDGPRFLQSPLPSSEKPYEYNQMIFNHSAGNTPTVQDHRLTHSSLSHQKLALILLSYQNFFIGGSMASKVKGNGPSLKALHTFIHGGHLKDTILYNCIDAETCALEEGRPIWESPDDKTNAITTYLGRLVPKPCAIWMNPEAKNVCIAQGFKYPEFDEIAAESSVTTTVWKSKDKEEPRLLRASTDRGIWRDLHALTILKKAEQSISEAPLIIQSHLNEFQGTDSMPIWCGELIKAKDAKILDSVESTFHLPLDLFAENGRKLYDAGVQHASIRAKLLADAVRAYGKSLFIDKPDTSTATRYYWHALDQQSKKLLDVIQTPELLDKDRFGISSDPWSKAVYFATLTAYDLTCSRSTPRQIQAYAAGLNKLFPKNKPTKKTTKKKRTTASPQTSSQPNSQPNSQLKLPL